MKKFTSLSLALIISSTLFSACTNSYEEHLVKNKELIKKFTNYLNNKQFDSLSSIVKADFKRHSQATTEMPELNSLDEFIKLQKGFLSSFSDQKVTIKKLLAEDNEVAAYATYSGTNDGPMTPFPATHKYAELNFTGIFRIDGGKIAEMWVEWDNLAFLKELGLFPPPGEAAK
jgi:steroid delta-isomerase-like uncharacterized protein